jgi:hypothetical protein
VMASHSMRASVARPATGESWSACAAIVQRGVGAPAPLPGLAGNSVALFVLSAKGTRAGEPIAGEGYLELTGYGGPLGGVLRIA